MNADHWYASLIFQLGAGGCFALLLVWTFLRFIQKTQKIHTDDTVAKDKNGNGMTYQQYNETVILPHLQNLQKGHERLLVEVAKLPTRAEQNADNAILHKRITEHENKCVNFKLRA